MTDYRRNFIPGGSYFFTVALAERSGRLLTDNIDLFRRAVSDVKRELPFDLIAMVVLPEHLHCVWALPTGDAGPPRYALPHALEEDQGGFLARFTTRRASLGKPVGERRTRHMATSLLGTHFTQR